MINSNSLFSFSANFQQVMDEDIFYIEAYNLKIAIHKLNNRQLIFPSFYINGQYSNDKSQAIDKPEKFFQATNLTCPSLFDQHKTF